MKIWCNREITGEYLRAGEIYDADVPAKGDVHLRNQRTGGGTYMRSWVYRDALASGALIPLVQP